MKTKSGLPAGKAGKKSLQYLGIILVIAILVLVAVLYYVSQMPEIKPEEKEPIKKEGISEEVLKKFRAPEEEGEEVPEDILEKFRAPE